MIPHVNEKWQTTVLLLVQRVQEFGSLQFFSILFWRPVSLLSLYSTGRRCKGGKRVPRLRSGLSVSLFLSLSLSIHVLRDVGTKKRGWSREGWKIKEEKKEEDIKVSFPFLARMIIQLAWITTRGKKKKHQQKLSISYLQLCFLRFPSIHCYHRIGLHSLFLSNWFVTE